MHAAADRPEFAPPPAPGLLRAYVLAVLAHVLLVLALMHGLRWQREAQDAGVEAELWAAVPQQAAPKAEPAPPPPPPPPQQQQVIKAPRPPEPPAKRDADIAIEREKQKRELEKQTQAELERERLEQRRKLEAQKKREEELARRKQEQAKLAEAKKRAEEEQERKARQQQQAVLDEKKREQQRQENLKRMQGMAGGTGAPSSEGTAARSAGPSATWAGRVVARVRPNIVFTDAISGNPKAEVEVRTSPDGTIVGMKLVRSSGVKAWDDAVLRALDKTEVLPRDVDGRVPSPVVIEFRPRG